MALRRSTKFDACVFHVMRICCNEGCHTTFDEKAVAKLMRMLPLLELWRGMGIKAACDSISRQRCSEPPLHNTDRSLDAWMCTRSVRCVEFEKIELCFLAIYALINVQCRYSGGIEIPCSYILPSIDASTDLLIRSVALSATAECLLACGRSIMRGQNER